MRRGVDTLLTAVLAIAIFGYVTSQTLGALRSSGAWSGNGRASTSTRRPMDPFAPLTALLDRPLPELTVADLRDPFSLGPPPEPVSSGRPVVRRPVVPPPAPRPVLTAIVWDNDPRAVVHWQGRDWTIRTGGLFDVFQVVAITRDQVALSRGGETIVLQRKRQGE